MEREANYKKRETLLWKAREPIRKFLTERFPEKFYDDIVMSERAEKVIGEVKKILYENRDMSYMILFNHFCYGDPFFAGLIADKIDPENKRQMIGPVAAAHTKLKGKKFSKEWFKDLKSNFSTILMNKVPRIANVETLPVVQTNDSSFSEEERNKNNLIFFKRLMRLSKRGPVGVLFPPEGHRSDDGKLQKGEEGIELVTKLIRPMVVLCLGISIEPEIEDGELVRRYNRNSLAFHKKINLNIENYFILNKKDKNPSTEEMMALEAKSIPLDLIPESNLTEEQRQKLAQMPKVRTIVESKKEQQLRKKRKRSTV